MSYERIIIAFSYDLESKPQLLTEMIATTLKSILDYIT